MASNSIILLAFVMLLASICLSRASGPSAIAQAQITATKAQAATQGAINVAKKYASGSTKGKAETCIETFGDAIDLLKQCLDALKAFNSGRIGDLQTWGSAAIADVDTCEDEFGSGEPADLKQATGKANDFLVTFLNIVNGL